MFSQYGRNPLHYSLHANKQHPRQETHKNSKGSVSLEMSLVNRSFAVLWCIGEVNPGRNSWHALWIWRVDERSIHGFHHWVAWAIVMSKKVAIVWSVIGVDMKQEKAEPFGKMLCLLGSLQSRLCITLGLRMSMWCSSCWKWIGDASIWVFSTHYKIFTEYQLYAWLCPHSWDDNRR